MRPAPQFDRLARVYRLLEMATFGSLLRRCRGTYLDELHSSRNALIIGDGDGRFTARLLEQNDVVLVDAVDVSRSMLLALIRNAGVHSGRVRTHHADARHWEPLNAPYDLVVTHFFLDCLTTEEVAALARRLRSHMTPSSRWLVSEFTVPDGWFGWIVAQPLVTVLYVAFWLVTGLRLFRLPDHRNALPQAGFTLKGWTRSLGGLLVSEIWEPEWAPEESTGVGRSC